MRNRRFTKKAVCEALDVPYNSRNCKQIILNITTNQAHVEFYHSGWLQFSPVYEGNNPEIAQNAIVSYSL